MKTGILTVDKDTFSKYDKSEKNYAELGRNFGINVNPDNPDGHMLSGDWFRIQAISNIIHAGCISDFTFPPQASFSQTLPARKALPGISSTGYTSLPADTQESAANFQLMSLRNNPSTSPPFLPITTQPSTSGSRDTVEPMDTDDVRPNLNGDEMNSRANDVERRVSPEGGHDQQDVRPKVKNLTSSEKDTSPSTLTASSRSQRRRSISASASYNQEVQVDSVIIKHVIQMHGNLVQKIEDKYKVTVKTQYHGHEGSCLIFGDDKAKVDTAANRLSETFVLYQERVEKLSFPVDLNRESLEELYDKLGKIVTSRHTEVTYHLNEESISLVCENDKIDVLHRSMDVILDEIKKAETQNRLRLHSTKVTTPRKESNDHELVTYADVNLMKFIMSVQKSDLDQCEKKYNVEICVKVAGEDAVDMAKVTIKSKNVKNNEEAQVKLNKILAKYEQVIVSDDIKDVSITTKLKQKAEDIESDLLHFIVIDCDEDKRIIQFIGFKDDVYKAKKKMNEFLSSIDVIQNPRRRKPKLDEGAVTKDKDSHSNHRHSQRMSLHHQPSTSTSPSPPPPSSFKSNSALLTSVHVLAYDITRMDVDIIVNAANENLDHGGGVARAIAKAAGDHLVQDCNRHVKSFGPVKLTENYISTAGNLRCKEVMHAIGPVYNAAIHSECYSALQNTIWNCLVGADLRFASSIAIPAISSGLFHFPNHEVADIIVGVTCDFLMAKKNVIFLKDIYLVDIRSSMIDLFQKSCEKQRELRKETRFTGKISLSELAAPFMPSVGTQSSQFSNHNNRPSSHAGTSTSYYDQSTGASASSTSNYTYNKDNFHKPSYSDVTKSGKSTHGRSNRSFSRSASSSSDGSKASSPTKPGPIGDMKGDKDEEEMCSICMCPPTNPKTLDKCKHTFCKDCIEECFEKMKKACPICGQAYGKITGNQPINGTMFERVDRFGTSLPGYKSHATIVIDYNFPDGVQEEGHPNPGQRYKGTRRTAFLPDNDEGRKVLKLLKKAFKARLVFTVGRSVTSGVDNIVTWNDIHHKTSRTGGPEKFGYPDKTYLTRVQEELAAKGIK